MELSDIQLERLQALKDKKAEIISLRSGVRDRKSKISEILNDFDNYYDNNFIDPPSEYNTGEGVNLANPDILYDTLERNLRTLYDQGELEANKESELNNTKNSLEDAWDGGPSLKTRSKWEDQIEKETGGLSKNRKIRDLRKVVAKTAEQIGAEQGGLGIIT
tara:strand:+ start:186 stop:671 length:486 start_codon:yes stop_codon:yes gene_type:complete